jgi:hypothetical protein
MKNKGCGSEMEILGPGLKSEELMRNVERDARISPGILPG